MWLVRDSAQATMMLAAPSDSAILDRFQGTAEPYSNGYVLKRCATNNENARALQDVLPWLTPKPLGLQTSAGCGDRLGVATPGHAMAFQQLNGNIAPIFSQQSIREMTRTKRAPEEVMRDATWGTFEAGWRGPVGADADHLKTPADIDACVQAGFSFFTIDPGAHVDDAAHDASPEELGQKVGALPWKDLESSHNNLLTQYGNKTLKLEDRKLVMSSGEIMRAAAKYGRAVAHVARMYRHLEAKGLPFELEVSIDETETPTSHAEHAYIALELKRLGVQFISLAPRYIGQFEKGIDYIGDLAKLRDNLSGHAAIARALGPYKLSLHSGSDKFSVYPLIQDVTGGMVHLKTAGTSYLEALRVIARFASDLFRTLTALSKERFEKDRASYHISAQLQNVPDLSTLDDAQLPELLDQDDTRQVLHVTFGSILDAYKPEMMCVLAAHEEAHYAGLARHFTRHLEPFVTKA